MMEAVLGPVESVPVKLNVLNTCAEDGVRGHLRHDITGARVGNQDPAVGGFLELAYIGATYTRGGDACEGYTGQGSCYLAVAARSDTLKGYRTADGTGVAGREIIDHTLTQGGRADAQVTARGEGSTCQIKYAADNQACIYRYAGSVGNLEIAGCRQQVTRSLGSSAVKNVVYIW